MNGHRDNTGEASLDELMRWVREDLDSRPGARQAPPPQSPPQRPRWWAGLPGGLRRWLAGRRRAR